MLVLAQVRLFVGLSWPRIRDQAEPPNKAIRLSGAAYHGGRKPFNAENVNIGRCEELEPSVIEYWKNGKWVRSKRVFYTDGDVREWYKHMRSRIDGLTIVKPLSEVCKL